MAGPTAADRRLSEWCQQLFAGAINRQQYGSAWAALAELFDACGVQLLRDVDTPLDGLAPHSPVRVFDRSVRRGPLAQALAGSGADYGMCAFIRHANEGSDVLVLLRNVTPFDAAACDWIELLAAHVRAALDLADQLASPLPTTASAAQLARLFPTPCLLTDEAGRCIERNDAFDKTIGVLSGTVRNGRVVFGDPFLQDSWQQALVEARATAATQSLLANAPSGSRWKVHLVPFACINSHAERTPRHLMFALFESFGAAPTQTLTVPSSRPLTKAELEVLASLLLGQTAKVIARTRGASVNTVRSQITAILGKTGHRTQKELIASFSTSTFEAMVARNETGEPR